MGFQVFQYSLSIKCQITAQDRSFGQEQSYYFLVPIITIYFVYKIHNNTKFQKQEVQLTQMSSPLQANQTKQAIIS